VLHLPQPSVSFVGPEALGELLDGVRRTHLLVVPGPVKSLDQGRTLCDVPKFLHLFTCKGPSRELLDDIRLIILDCIQLLHFLYVDSRPPLDPENLTEDHQVVGLTPELEVYLLRKVSSQVLLDHDRVLCFLEPLLLHLGQEHSDVALNVDDNELKFHVPDSLPC
jgi:hypothetical protein